MDGLSPWVRSWTVEARQAGHEHAFCVFIMNGNFM